ncbi:MAG: M48 family metallopeptidase [Bdellovibrio sp.]|nr:M48 family metallopeptidase [Methylotenera sp.]
MSFEAQYFDGLSSRAKMVVVQVLAQTKQLTFDAEGLTHTFALADISVQAKLGLAKRLIDLPDKGRLEAVDISTLEATMPSKASTFWRALHHIENNLGWVLVVLIATVLSGWLFLQFGVPKLAEYVAKATPPTMETKIGKQALDGIDQLYFSPSKADPARKASITAALKQLCVALKDCPQYQLEFRDGGVIGANAFALPGGYVVVTDQIIELSRNDTEIVAVLAHELGHVKQRHAFRQSLQGVLSGLILAAITGDVSTIGSGLPAVLMQMRYSREHEAESDRYALNALQKACLPPKAFADILQRLEAQMPDKAKATEHKTAQNNNKADANKTTTTPLNHDAVSEMLASHPDTQARIQPFLAARQSCI